MEAIWMMVLSFFAAYGIVQVAVGIMLASGKRKCKGAKSYRVLMLKDCQDTAEGLIRSIAWKDGDEELVVLDMDSQDETPQLLGRLARELDFLRVMTPEEYQGYHQEMMEER